MSEGQIKKFMYVNRKAPHGTIYALESLEVVLIAAAVIAGVVGEPQDLVQQLLCGGLVRRHQRHSDLGPLQPVVQAGFGG